MSSGSPPFPEVDFCFPAKRLENARLVLEPFAFQSHAEAFVQGSKDHPELFDFLGFGPFATTAAFGEFYNRVVAPTDTELLYAILAKPSSADEPGRFAGIIGLHDASLANAVVEIGHVTILPAFHRTFVTSNAIGLLLQYALDPPPQGLGLRRCQWKAHALNEASKRVAERMRFSFEGVLRFQRVVPLDRVGNGFDTSRLPEVMGRKLGPSRDSAMYAHYCDEWPEKRSEVVAVMERTK